MNKQGVVILALGHAYWGRWAYNLAMSIKFSSPKMPITLLYSDAGKTHIHDVTFFDKMIEIPPEHYTTNGRISYLRAKTCIYKLSPYKETVYLDADMIWLPQTPIDNLFDSLVDVDFTMANRGFMDLNDEDLSDTFGVWASPKHIKEVFNFKEGKFYNLSSEMIYFKKKKNIGKLFSDASKYYDDETYNHVYFNGGMPDELPFTIAMIKNKIYPHIDNYLPVYWEAATNPPRRLSGAELNAFMAYSMGGHIPHPTMKKTYNNFVQFYYKKFQKQYPYFWISKSEGWMPDRKTL